METNDVVTSLSALAHPLRLQVFRALVVSGQPGLTPTIMQRALHVPAATLSFHLGELIDSRLVTQSRSGRHLIYRAAYEQMNAVIGYLTENCCKGSACLPDAVDAAVRC